MQPFVIHTVEYQDDKGNVHTFKTSSLGDGAILKVVYLKFWPEYAKVKSFSGMWGPIVILLLFGGIIFFISQLFNEKYFEKMKQRKARKKMDNYWVELIAGLTFLIGALSVIHYLMIRKFHIMIRENKRAEKILSWQTIQPTPVDWEMKERLYGKYSSQF
jgi:hypothetical protein